MKTCIDQKIYNTDSSVLVKCVIEDEDLGEGYTRYNIKKVMRRKREGDFFLYVTKIATDRRCRILDVSQYIVPVDEDYVISFRKGLPDLWPE